MRFFYFVLFFITVATVQSCSSPSAAESSVPDDTAFAMTSYQGWLMRRLEADYLESLSLEELTSCSSVYRVAIHYYDPEDDSKAFRASKIIVDLSASSSAFDQALATKEAGIAEAQLPQLSEMRFRKSLVAAYEKSESVKEIMVREIKACEVHYSAARAYAAEKFGLEK